MPVKKLENKLIKLFIYPIAIGIACSALISVIALIIFSSTKDSKKEAYEMVRKWEEKKVLPIFNSIKHLLYDKFQYSFNYLYTIEQEYKFIDKNIHVKKLEKELKRKIINKYLINGNSITKSAQEYIHKITELKKKNKLFYSGIWSINPNIESLEDIEDEEYRNSVEEALFKIANTMPILNAMYNSNSNGNLLNSRKLTSSYFAISHLKLFVLYPILDETESAEENINNGLLNKTPLDYLKSFVLPRWCDHEEAEMPTYYYFQCRSWYKVISQHFNDNKQLAKLSLSNTYSFASDNSLGITACINLKTDFGYIKGNPNNYNMLCVDMIISSFTNIFDYFNSKLKGNFFINRVNNKIPFYYPGITQNKNLFRTTKYRFSISDDFYLDELIEHKYFEHYIVKSYDENIFKYADTFNIKYNDNVLLNKEHLIYKTLYHNYNINFKSEYCSNKELESLRIMFESINDSYKFTSKMKYCSIFKNRNEYQYIISPIFLNINTNLDQNKKKDFNIHLFTAVYLYDTSKYLYIIQQIDIKTYIRLLIQIFLIIIISFVLLLIGYNFIIVISRQIVYPMYNLKKTLEGLSSCNIKASNSNAITNFKKDVYRQENKLLSTSKKQKYLNNSNISEFKNLNNSIRLTDKNYDKSIEESSYNIEKVKKINIDKKYVNDPLKDGNVNVNNFNNKFDNEFHKDNIKYNNNKIRHNSILNQNKQINNEKLNNKKFFKQIINTKNKNKFNTDYLLANSLNTTNSLKIFSNLEDSEENSTYLSDEEFIDKRPKEIQTLFDTLTKLQKVILFTKSNSLIELNDSNQMVNYIFSKYAFMDFSNELGTYICDSNIANISLILKCYDKSILHISNALDNDKYIKHILKNYLDYLSYKHNNICNINSIYNNKESFDINAYNNLSYRLKFNDNNSSNNIHNNSSFNNDKKNYSRSLINPDYLFKLLKNRMIIISNEESNNDSSYICTTTLNIKILNKLYLDKKSSTLYKKDITNLEKDTILNSVKQIYSKNYSNKSSFNTNEELNLPISKKSFSNSNSYTFNINKTFVVNDNLKDYLFYSRFPKVIYSYKKFFDLLEDLIDYGVKSNFIISDNFVDFDNKFFEKQIDYKHFSTHDQILQYNYDIKIENNNNLINESTTNFLLYINMFCSKSTHNLEKYENYLNQYIGISSHISYEAYIEANLELIEFKIKYRLIKEYNNNLNYTSKGKKYTDVLSRIYDNIENNAKLLNKKILELNVINNLDLNRLNSINLNNKNLVLRNKIKSTYINTRDIIEIDIFNNITEVKKYINYLLSKDDGLKNKLNHLLHIKSNLRYGNYIYHDVPATILNQRANYLLGLYFFKTKDYYNSINYFELSRKLDIVSDTLIIKYSILKIIEILNIIKEAYNLFNINCLDNSVLDSIIDLIESNNENNLTYTNSKTHDIKCNWKDKQEVLSINNKHTKFLLPCILIMNNKSNKPNLNENNNDNNKSFNVNNQSNINNANNRKTKKVLNYNYKNYLNYFENILNEEVKLSKIKSFNKHIKDLNIELEQFSECHNNVILLINSNLLLNSKKKVFSIKLVYDIFDNYVNGGDKICIIIYDECSKTILSLTEKNKLNYNYILKQIVNLNEYYNENSCDINSNKSRNIQINYKKFDNKVYSILISVIKQFSNANLYLNFKNWILLITDYLNNDEAVYLKSLSVENSNNNDIKFIKGLKNNLNFNFCLINMKLKKSKDDKINKNIKKSNNSLIIEPDILFTQTIGNVFSFKEVNLIDYYKLYELKFILSNIGKINDHIVFCNEKYVN